MLARLLHDPGVVIGLALLAGMTAQAIAHRLRIPSIIVLLLVGVVLGPDGWNVLRPWVLGPALRYLIGFSVSIILFEGALNLDLKQLRREVRSIRQLATIGVLVTATLSVLAARFILGWELPVAFLFGALITVTGPTVITPLVRRMRLRSRISTVLQAEGIFVDAIGAILAVVALEIVLGGDERSFALGAVGAVFRIFTGVVIGALGGAIIALLLSREGLIPEAMHRIFALAMVMALFQISNALVSESGILATVVAGLVVGNTRSHGMFELREFQEQLTILFLGLVFVLLAADVRLGEVQALGSRAALMLAALMLVIRPLNVWLATRKTDLTRKEKIFLGFMAPRGIVAAAVASLFAEALRAAGIAGGTELRAMVFLVIAVTVVVSGLGGTAMARLLGLRRSSLSGYVILGAQPVARALGRVLRDGGADVLLIDSNPQQCLAAEKEGLRVIYGSGLSENIQQRAELDVRAGCIGATTNDEVNLLFARRARVVYRVPRAWVALRRGQLNVTPDTVRRFGGRLLFALPVNLEAWNSILARDLAQISGWKATVNVSLAAAGETRELLLPLAVQRGKKIFPYDEEAGLRRGDVLFVLQEKRAEIAEAIRAQGFVPIDAAVAVA